MASTDHSVLRKNLPIPGDGLDAAHMPGHWLLASLGKRVLRAGGVELTRWMLDALGVDPEDRVVELAAGLGATARLTLARRPTSYTAVDRDATAVAALSVLAAPGPTKVRAIRSDAADTGLPDGYASVVYGEAMLTMQPHAAKRRVVREARRLLDDSTGRYAIHELCLLPDALEPALANRITADLQDAIHVGARPLTPSDWRELLTDEGFTVIARKTAPTALLEPRRLVADEGLIPALRIAGRALQDPGTLRHVLRMRRIFQRHSAHLGAISLLAVPTPPQP